MFKVGDIVIANERAKGIYSITKPGWIGEVVKAYRNLIVVAGREGGFTVDPIYFDIYKDPFDTKDVLRLI